MTTQPANNEFAPATIDDFLERRPRFSGCHYKLLPAGRSLAIDVSGQPSIDRQAMSARSVISTATIDRVGDLLIPRGCQLDNYVKNPVVMWAHGMEGIAPPIGTSRDPDGNVAVIITDDDVQATCWFSQKSLEAAQIFELIDEGIVRATSVRETPIKSHLQRDPIAGDVLIVEEWDLEEWSWCAIGVNPDAVAKTLHRNRLGGQPIAASIVKSLISVAPTSKRWGIGLPMEKTNMDPGRPNDDDGATAVADEQTTEPIDDDSGSDAENEPYGSTVVAAVHASLAAAIHNIEEAMGPLENPPVKEGLTEILTALQSQMAAVEGLHSVNYPDQDSLKADDNEGDGSGESMKAFLAAGRIAPLQVLGLGSRLKRLVGATNLTLDQRRTLGDVARQMTRLVSQSKSYQQDADATKIAALQKSIGELTGLVGTIRK